MFYFTSKDVFNLHFKLLISYVNESFKLFAWYSVDLFYILLTLNIAHLSQSRLHRPWGSNNPDSHFSVSGFSIFIEMTSGRPVYPIWHSNCLVTIYLKDFVCRFGHLSIMLLLLKCVLFWSLIELSCLLSLLAMCLCHIGRIMYCLLLDQITRAVQN